MEPNNGVTVTGDRFTMDPPMTVEDLDVQLLPDLPNDVTLKMITAKLRWGDSFHLSAVSRGWQKAVQNHLVHDARVRTQSTETFAVVMRVLNRTTPIRRISLYSMRDESWYELPPIPGCCTGVPPYAKCVSLGAKLYVLGGGKEPCRDRAPGQNRDALIRRLAGSTNVYVMDLAGQRQWKECASMEEPRLHFGSGVIDEKIYVFGGISNGQPNCATEVYDPKVDAWLRRTPMISFRFNHHVETVGEELFAYGGKCHKFTVSNRRNDDDAEDDDDPPESPLDIEVYHPIKDEWRLIELAGRNSMEAMLTALGKSYLWPILPSCAFVRIEPRVVPYGTYLVDDKLLLYVVHDRVPFRTRLLQSNRLGPETTAIVWERIKCPCHHEGCSGCSINFPVGSIQL